MLTYHEPCSELIVSLMHTFKLMMTILNISVQLQLGKGEENSLPNENETSSCPRNESVLQNIVKSLNNLSQELQNLKQDIYKGGSQNPASSCQELYTYSKPSGYYWVKSGPSSLAVKVYCDMDRVCGCNAGSRGWMKVADIDMTKQLQCPEGFKLITRTTPPYRTCGRPDSLVGCVSTSFAVNGLRYSRVCGRVVGYQVGSPDAFHYQSRGLESQYVSGISLTHGQSPRNHIWTFAGAVNEASRYRTSVCPCSYSGSTASVPSFVGNDYFCDSGIRGSGGFASG